jgi:hypothetical protein
MKASAQALGLLLAINAGVGCASTRSSVPPGIAGLWISAFEQSEFRPCDLATQGRVWAEMDTTISNAIWRRVPSVSPMPEADTLFVRWDGTLSPPRNPRARLGGAYGHGGAYTHEFRVNTLYEARRATAGDCGMRAPPSRPAR